MNIQYVPLLGVLREVYTTPRGPARFDRYLRTVLNADGTDVELLPLLAANPMAKDHVTALLDALLGLDADGIGAHSAAEAAARLPDEPGDYRATLVVADDLMGGWTNRYAYEFDFRVGYGPQGKRFWGPVGVLWSSEPASERAVREAIAAAVCRTAYMQRHGPPKALRDILAQEGHVMALADCAGPSLDADDIEYTREVLTPYLDATDKRTVMECLFGDPAGATLGFTPRGLSHWAGLALALHDGRAAVAVAASPV
ncbi:MAG TPA: hypothetical protein VKD90_03025 [Gemmataceae bacterium]|nr:hypothetical protein [Gemmataceae bacterium]